MGFYGGSGFVIGGVVSCVIGSGLWALSGVNGGLGMGAPKNERDIVESTSTTTRPMA